MLTFLNCGVARCETMSTDSCQFFYECPACHTVSRPKSGDCSVFCSFGSVPCPPGQQRRCCPSR
ncbi:GDCCVxC domain-containing (seleno)protein [Burkholderia cenocepacia]